VEDQGDEGPAGGSAMEMKGLLTLMVQAPPPAGSARTSTPARTPPLAEKVVDIGALAQERDRGRSGREARQFGR
jgi:hypothetical protein